MQLSITAEEYDRRQDALRTELEKRGLSGAYLTDPVSIFYLTGFYMVSTERPAALVMPLVGAPGFVGPRLEEGHIDRKGGRISMIRTYFDYPGDTHPMEAIAEFLAEMGLAKGGVGTDNPAGYACQLGYAGPRLCDLLPRTEFEDLGDVIPRMRHVKSEEEVALMRLSCRFADRAMEHLVAEIAEGVWDVEAGLSATLAATRDLGKELGTDYVQSVAGFAPVSVGFRGQIGPGSAIPHIFATRRRLTAGDVLGAGASCEMGGMRCELERTFVFGKPDAEQVRCFDAMVRAQQAAIEALRPGSPCAAADQAAWDVFEEAGLSDRTLHHTGHGLGLEFHESPFLDRGDATVVEPGMIFAVEPGIYLPGFGGFRHSDTVLVTDAGPEILSAFPRELAPCTVPVKKKRKRRKAPKKRKAT